MKTPMAKNLTPTTKLPAARVRAIAVASSTDPRTVARYIRGEHVAPLPEERIVRALCDAGLTQFVRRRRPTTTASRKS